MKFTEREMTVAVEAVAQQGFDALPKILRRRAGAESWAELGKGARYPHLVAAGDLVLPGLLELPERATVGSTPAFSEQEYADAAEHVLRTRADAKKPGSWDETPERKRRKAVPGVAAVLGVAVRAMPIRQDPDAIIVPDHL